MKRRVHEFDLINTVYSPKEARQVMVRLINDKINFLNLKVLSLYERYSGDPAHLEKRIAELNEAEKYLVDVLNGLENDSFEVDIKCPVKFKIKRTKRKSRAKSQVTAVVEQENIHA